MPGAAFGCLAGLSAMGLMCAKVVPWMRLKPPSNKMTPHDLEEARDGQLSVGSAWRMLKAGATMEG